MTTMTAAQLRAQTGGMEPDPEVPQRPRPPRQYPAAYKLRVLEEYERLDKAGKGALLRREGLYTSLVSEWRKQRDRAPWPRCSSAAAAHPQIRVTRSWPGWSATTRGYVTSWSGPAR